MKPYLEKSSLGTFWPFFVLALFKIYVDDRKPALLICPNDIILLKYNSSTQYAKALKILGIYNSPKDLSYDRSVTRTVGGGN